MARVTKSKSGWHLGMAKEANWYIDYNLPKWLAPGDIRRKVAKIAKFPSDRRMKRKLQFTKVVGTWDDVVFITKTQRGWHLGAWATVFQRWLAPSGAVRCVLVKMKGNSPDPKVVGTLGSACAFRVGECAIRTCRGASWRASQPWLLPLRLSSTHDEASSLRSREASSPAP